MPPFIPPNGNGIIPNFPGGVGFPAAPAGFGPLFGDAGPGLVGPNARFLSTRVPQPLIGIMQLPVGSAPPGGPQGMPIPRINIPEPPLSMLLEAAAGPSPGQLTPVVPPTPPGFGGMVPLLLVVPVDAGPPDFASLPVFPTTPLTLLLGANSPPAPQGKILEMFQYNVPESPAVYDYLTLAFRIYYIHESNHTIVATVYGPMTVQMNLEDPTIFFEWPVGVDYQIDAYLVGYWWDEAGRGWRQTTGATNSLMGTGSDTAMPAGTPPLISVPALSGIMTLNPMP